MRRQHLIRIDVVAQPKAICVRIRISFGNRKIAVSKPIWLSMHRN